MSESATALPSSFEPFSLFIEACDTSNRERGPHFIHVRIDPALLKKALRWHDLCNTESISVCTENLAPFDWDRAPHSADSVDHGTNQSTQFTDWHLHVDGDQFWFQGDVNGTRLTESRIALAAEMAERIAAEMAERIAAEMAERIAAQEPDPSNPFAPVRRHMSV